MDTFGFTLKKFKTLSVQNRHRHLVMWLSGIYHHLTTNRFSHQALSMFASQYNQILSAVNMPLFTAPDSDQVRPWIEVLSDRIHYHRCEAGLSCRDDALLGPVHTGDASGSAISFDCHLALDGLRSLFNIGSIFRTCEAAGFSSIILGRTPGSEHPGVQKTSMGAHQWVAQEKTNDLAWTLHQKKPLGYRIIGIETMKTAVAYDRFSWQDKTIAVLGNEEYGISSSVLRVCDNMVCIPMFGRKNSVNVANAAAIICFRVAGAVSQQTVESP